MTPVVVRKPVPVVKAVGKESFKEIEWYDPRLSRKQRAELILQAYR